MNFLTTNRHEQLPANKHRRQRAFGLGSAPASGAGDRALAITNFSGKYAMLRLIRAIRVIHGQIRVYSGTIRG
jgi:hypothetical protein